MKKSVILKFTIFVEQNVTNFLDLGFGYYKDQQGQHICLVKTIFVAHAPCMDGKKVTSPRILGVWITNFTQSQVLRFSLP